MKRFYIKFEGAVPEFPSDVVILKQLSDNEFLIQSMKIPQKWYLIAEITER